MEAVCCFSLPDRRRAIPASIFEMTNIQRPTVTMNSSNNKKKEGIFIIIIIIISISFPRAFPTRTRRTGTPHSHSLVSRFRSPSENHLGPGLSARQITKKSATEQPSRPSFVSVVHRDTPFRNVRKSSQPSKSVQSRDLKTSFFFKLLMQSTHERNLFKMI